MIINTIPNRAILRLDGPDTLALLERTVTHTVSDWPEGEARYGALLTPQGKVIADYIAVRTKTGVLIDCHEDAAGDLQKRLKMFRLRSAVEITAEALVDMSWYPCEPGYGAVGGVSAVYMDPRSGGKIARGLIDHKEWEQVFGAPYTKAKKDITAHTTQMIELGIPEWGRDYRAAEVFPTDINMDHMNGIDYKKGCFVGQEVASRMMRKGTIRKRTLRVAGSALEPGADIIAKTSIGKVTSASDGNGLALIRLDRLAAQSLEGHALTCNDEAVRVLTEEGDWATEEIGNFYADID